MKIINLVNLIIKKESLHVEGRGGTKVMSLIFLTNTLIKN